MAEAACAGGASHGRQPYDAKASASGVRAPGDERLPLRLAWQAPT